MEKSHDDMVRKRSHLSAEEKYQIFLEAAMAKAFNTKAFAMSAQRNTASPLTSQARNLAREQEINRIYNCTLP